MGSIQGARRILIQVLWKPVKCFCVILLTNQPTNRHVWKHNLHVGDSKRYDDVSGWTGDFKFLRESLNSKCRTCRLNMWAPSDLIWFGCCVLRMGGCVWVCAPLIWGRTIESDDVSTVMSMYCDTRCWWVNMPECLICCKSMCLNNFKRDGSCQCKIFIHSLILYNRSDNTHLQSWIL